MLFPYLTICPAVFHLFFVDQTQSLQGQFRIIDIDTIRFLGDQIAQPTGRYDLDILLAGFCDHMFYDIFRLTDLSINQARLHGGNRLLCQDMLRFADLDLR